MNTTIPLWLGICILLLLANLPTAWRWYWRRVQRRRMMERIAEQLYQDQVLLFKENLRRRHSRDLTSGVWWLS